MMTTHPAEANGFSLVEVIAAMVILTMGILAMAASTGYVFTRLGDSGRSTERSLATQQVIEQLRATPFANVQNGSTTIGAYTLSWRIVSQPSSGLMTVRIVNQGPGYVAGQGWSSTVRDSTEITLLR